MKTWLSIFLIVLYAVALVRPVYPLLEYAVKLEEYKAKCINKARPEMHCDGRCILMQKLRAFYPEEPDPVAPVPPKINMDDYPVSLAEQPITRTVPFVIPSTGHTFPPVCHPRTFIVDIFRPPQA